MGYNHLFVHYNWKKKKEIMGGRSDDEYRKMIEILELYRTSADMDQIEKMFNEKEKPGNTE